MWRIEPAGDRALLVRLGTKVDPQLLGLVLALDHQLTEWKLPGLLSTVPAYASLLCHFDPQSTGAQQLEARIRELEPTLEPVTPSGDLVHVPTVYEGEDLADVATATGLSIDEVIALHANREYLVYCIGFAPGFTYCGELDQRLAMPRKSSPRRVVPAGSVAIADRQTGIYAVATPGGWNLIGRTDLVLFDPNVNPPARFHAGDRLRFVPRR